MSSGERRGLLESAKKDEKKQSPEESNYKCAGRKVVLMVAARACCHQPLRNRVDRILCRKEEKKQKHVPLVMLAPSSNVKTR